MSFQKWTEILIWFWLGRDVMKNSAIESVLLNKIIFKIGSQSAGCW